MNISRETNYSHRFLCSIQNQSSSPFLGLSMFLACSQIWDIFQLHVLIKNGSYKKVCTKLNKTRLTLYKRVYSHCNQWQLGISIGNWSNERIEGKLLARFYCRSSPLAARKSGSRIGNTFSATRTTLLNTLLIYSVYMSIYCQYTVCCMFCLLISASKNRDLFVSYVRTYVCRQEDLEPRIQA